MTPTERKAIKAGKHERIKALLKNIVKPQAAPLQPDLAASVKKQTVKNRQPRPSRAHMREVYSVDEVMSEEQHKLQHVQGQ